MKFLYIFVLLITATYAAWLDVTPSQKAKIDKYNEECATESGVDLDLIEQAKIGTFSDDVKVKRHGLCFSKKLGFQNSDGVVQQQMIRQKLKTKIDDDDKVDNIISVCCKTMGTPEETGYQMLKCLHSNVPAGVVFID